MRVVTVSGARDSGKTTLIREMVARSGAAGKGSAVIVNEEGRVPYDDDFVGFHGLTVEYIRGGWVGCSLASGLVDLIKRIKRNVNPDLLFIEPSEMVVTRELKGVAGMGLRDIRYKTGPFITLVDGPQFPFLWSERRALLLGQVKDADLVAVSRTDLIGTDDVESINGLLQDHCGPLIPLSAQNGDNMEEVMKRID